MRRINRFYSKTLTCLIDSRALRGTDEYGEEERGEGELKNRVVKVDVVRGRGEEGVQLRVGEVDMQELWGGVDQGDRREGRSNKLAYHPGW